MFRWRFGNILQVNKKFLSFVPSDRYENVWELDGGLDSCLQWITGNWPLNMPFIWFCWLGKDKHETGIDVSRFESEPVELLAQDVLQGSRLDGDNLARLLNAIEQSGFTAHVKFADNKEMSGFWLLLGIV